MHVGYLCSARHPLDDSRMVHFYATSPHQGGTHECTDFGSTKAGSTSYGRVSRTSSLNDASSHTGSDSTDLYGSYSGLAASMTLGGSSGGHGTSPMRSSLHGTLPRRYIALLGDAAEGGPTSHRGKAGFRDVHAELRSIVQFSQVTSLMVSAHAVGAILDEGLDSTQQQHKLLHGKTIGATMKLLPSLLCSRRPPFMYATLGLDPTVDPIELETALPQGALHCTVLVAGLGFVFPDSDRSPHLGALAFRLEHLYMCHQRLRDNEDEDPFSTVDVMNSPRSAASPDRSSPRRGSIGTGSASTAVAKIQRNRGETISECARIWWALLKAHPLPEGVAIDWDAFEVPSFQARRRHLLQIEPLRGRLAIADTTAGAAAVDDFQSQRVLRFFDSWFREHMASAVGYVGDLVGAAMVYQPVWSYVPRAEFGAEMRRTHFKTLDESVTLLNGSSVVVLPDPVRHSRKEWELCVQTNPVLFRFKAQNIRLQEVVTKMSKYLMCAVKDLRLLNQKSEAYATIFRSMHWVAGDSMLLLECATDAVLVAQCTHLQKVHAVDVNFAPYEELSALARRLDRYKPRLLVVAHVTEIGLVMPLDRIVSLCGDMGVTVVIDGSDAIGNVDCNVAAIGADYYLTSMHGYSMCYPGVTALVVNGRRQLAMTTLTVSYYYGKGFSEEWTYTGLQDISMWLSAKQSLQFIKYIATGAKGYCRSLAKEAQQYLCNLWKVAPLFEFKPRHGIVCIRLPQQILNVDLTATGRKTHSALRVTPQMGSHRPTAGQPTGRADALFIQTLLAQEGIHVGVVPLDYSQFGGGLAVRISFQIYNGMEDVRRLGNAVLRLAGMHR